MVGMAAKNDATTGSTKVRPGEMRPTKRPPKNQTGIVTSIPLPPSKSKSGTTMGNPITSAAVRTPWTMSEMSIQVRLKPSCW